VTERAVNLLVAALLLLAAAVGIGRMRRPAAPPIVMPRVLPPIAKIEMHIDRYREGLRIWEAIRDEALRREEHGR